MSEVAILIGSHPVWICAAFFAEEKCRAGWDTMRLWGILMLTPRLAMVLGVSASPAERVFHETG